MSHVRRVVENNDAAVPHQCVDVYERFVVERRIELVCRQIGTERSADLDRLDGSATGRTAAVVLDEFAQREAEGSLDEAAAPDVAAELERQGPLRAVHAHLCVALAAEVDDIRH